MPPGITVSQPGGIWQRERVKTPLLAFLLQEKEIVIQS